MYCWDLFDLFQFNITFRWLFFRLNDLVNLFLNALEVFDYIQETFLIERVQNERIIWAFVIEIFITDFPKANLTLKVHFDSLHAEIQFFYVRCQGFIEKTCFILIEG